MRIPLQKHRQAVRKTAREREMQTNTQGETNRQTNRNIFKEIIFFFFLQILIILNSFPSVSTFLCNMSLNKHVVFKKFTIQSVLG